MLVCNSNNLFLFQHANEDVERMLLGNKCDMDDKRVVPKGKGEQVRVSRVSSHDSGRGLPAGTVVPPH